MKISYTLLSIMPTPHLKFHRFYSLSFYFFVLFTITIGVWPGQEEILPFDHQDKILHFTYYFLSFSYFVQFLDVKKSLIALFVVGVFVEIAQSLSTYRTSEFLDVVANSLGLFFSYLCRGKYSYLNFIEKKLLD
jgi:VanZ family protein